MPNGRGRFAKKIDTVHWTVFQATQASLSAGSEGILLSQAQHLPETMLRLRGEWACCLAGAASDAVGALVTAGIILVPEGTGTTVLWAPQTDGDAPWIWWDTMSLSPPG